MCADRGQDVPWTIRTALLVSATLLLYSGINLWTAREPPADRRPEVLRVAVLPSVDPASMRAAYAPLVKHIEEHIGIRCELEVPATHTELVERFSRGEFDLAWFDSLMFLRAELACGALPLAMREEDERMTSVFIVRSEDDDKSIADFAGRSFALGAELSTSGHLMARVHLAESGLELDELFPDAHPHGGHDETALHVRDGKADIGFASSEAVERMFRDGTLSRDDVTVRERTAPYVGNLWATQRDLDSDLRTKLSEALLILDRSNRSHRPLLINVGAGGYLPVWTGELDAIRGMAVRYGILGTR